MHVDSLVSFHFCWGWFLFFLALAQLFAVILCIYSAIFLPIHITCKNYSLTGKVINNNLHAEIKEGLAHQLLLTNNHDHIIIGHCNKNNLDHFFVLKTHKDGSLDTSFGKNGAIINNYNNTKTQATTACLCTDESILIAGIHFIENRSYIFISNLPARSKTK